MSFKNGPLLFTLLPSITLLKLLDYTYFSIIIYFKTSLDRFF